MNDVEILNTIKMILKITDTTQDTLIKYYISSVKRKVMNICSLFSFPDELVDMIVDVIVKKLNAGNVSGFDSINIGDTNIKLKNSDKDIDDFIIEHMDELKNFMYAEVI
jgi:hypothetical protein